MGGGICLVLYRLQKPRGKRPRPSRGVRVQEVGRAVQVLSAQLPAPGGPRPAPPDHPFPHRATEATDGARAAHRSPMSHRPN
jgi:hypothetical protein